jgi:DNA-binding CsgD family transcriptional regulator
LIEDEAADVVVVVLAIDDAALAERVVRSIESSSGFRLAAPGEPADVEVKAPASAASGDLEPALTPRELQVLALLAEGASNKAIAGRLGISVHTAKFHVGQLLDKLDATGRTDAVAHAARRGVIHL